MKAIREALGMSGADLAARMDVTPASVSGLERSERERRIRLDTLDRAAAALGCDLVYVLVPRRTLADTVEAQARRKVEGEVRAVGRTMDLEAQPADIDEEVVREQMKRLIDSGRLWK